MSSSYKYDVFLSHNSKDKSVVIEIAKKLTLQGLNVWLDTLDLRPGKKWQTELEQGINNSAAIAVFIGPSGFGKWEDEEMLAAIDKQARNPDNRVIPVILPGGDDKDVSERLFLSQRAWVDFRSGIDDEDALMRLVAGIKGVSVREMGRDVNTSSHSSDSHTGVDERLNQRTRLKFVNHHEIIRFIYAKQAPPYHLIDGPAGFGKTMIVRKLQSYFRDDNWRTAYVGIDHKRTLDDITKTIADELDIVVDEFSGRALAKAFYEQKVHKEDSGLVLFFDVEMNTRHKFEKDWVQANKTIERLLRTTIPDIASELQRLGFQSEMHSPFRVVVSSRYIMRDLPEKLSLKLAPSQLEPLKYKHIRIAVKYFLEASGIHETNSEINQLTAHIMYYTGGHPGCIAEILDLYRNEEMLPLNKFFEDYEQKIRAIVRQEIDDLRFGIDDKLRDVFDEISIYRFVDTDILKKYVEDKKYQYLNFSDEFALSDELFRTYLMGNWSEGYFLKDSITRKLMPLLLLREKGYRFSVSLQEPIQICKARLEQEHAQLPHKWLVEYYFQYLQQYLGKIQDVKVRAQIREEFFSHIIQDGFDLFANRHDVRRFRNAMIEALDSDDELEFTINYYLRGDEYIHDESSPYQCFYNQLIALFRRN